MIDGTWKPTPVWGGIASGMVDVDAIAPTLAADLRVGLAEQRAAIVAGRLAPFAAPLRDNEGTVRLARGKLDDAHLQTMDWLVEGVVGSVPKAR